MFTSLEIRLASLISEWYGDPVPVVLESVADLAPAERLQILRDNVQDIEAMRWFAENCERETNAN